MLKSFPPSSRVSPLSTILTRMPRCEYTRRPLSAAKQHPNHAQKHQYRPRLEALDRTGAILWARPEALLKLAFQSKGVSLHRSIGPASVARCGGKPHCVVLNEAHQEGTKRACISQLLPEGVPFLQHGRHVREKTHPSLKPKTHFSFNFDPDLEMRCRTPQARLLMCSSF